MKFLLEQLNNKEIAIIIIAFCSLLFFIYKSDKPTKIILIESIISLIKVFFNKRTWWIQFISIVYILFILSLLNKLQFYNINYAHSFLIFINSYIFLLKTYLEHNNKNYIFKGLIKNLPCMTIATSIINRKIFSIYCELFIIILMLFFTLIISIILAQKEKVYTKTLNILYFFVLIFYIFLIYFSIEEMYHSWENMYSIQTLFPFFIPLFINIILIPLIYIIGIVFFYHDIFHFISINIKIMDKYKIIKTIGFSLNKIRIFFNKNFTKLKLVKNKNELDELIKNNSN